MDLYDLLFAKSLCSSGAVNSVNGKTGTVVLSADDVGALPDTTVTHETWTFTLDDNTTVTKEVVLWIG